MIYNYVVNQLLHLGNSFNRFFWDSFLSLILFFFLKVKDVRVSPALSFKEMSKNSKRYLEASGEWELVGILGETAILQFGIDEWDIITFWVRESSELSVVIKYSYYKASLNNTFALVSYKKLHLKVQKVHLKYYLL